MKKIIVSILAILLILGLSGCGLFDKDINSLDDLADSNKTKEVFISENGKYVSYLLLSDNYNGNILLLRNELLEDLQPLNEHSAIYEGSSIDKYLSGEFLTRFTEETLSKIVAVPIKVTTKESLYSNGKETYSIERKSFLLSYSEVGYSEITTAANEGNKLTNFTDDKSRVAYRGSVPCGWWLRSPYTGYDSVTWSVGPDGAKTELSSSIENGVRPAICLSKDTSLTLSDEIIDGKSVYTVK